MKIRVEDRPHTRVSPSSFDRISKCTMSYKLAEKAPPRVAGPDATIGTAVHALLEEALRGRDTAQIEAVIVDDQEVKADEEMRTSVKAATDYTGNHIGGRELMVECQISLPWGRISGYVDFATADAPWIVGDFKNGFNVVAPHSPQLGLYALGIILARTGTIEGQGEVTTVIIQPRAKAEPIRSHIWSFADLRDLRNQLIETLDRIRREDFTYAFGDHCRWCPAAAVCPQLEAVARDAVAAQLAVPELVAEGHLGSARLDAALTTALALEHWSRQVHDVAKKYLMAGGKLENFKIVKKRSGSLTVVGQDDPRPELDIAGTLKSALQSRTASRFLASAKKSVHPR